MRPDLSEKEYHEFFVRPILHLRFSVEELAKMLESRLEGLTKHIYENEIAANGIKNSKAEAIRAIEGFNFACDSLCENIKIQMESSFRRIEGGEDEK